jgi:hypothetical protein
MRGHKAPVFSGLVFIVRAHLPRPSAEPGAPTALRQVSCAHIDVFSFNANALTPLKLIELQKYQP